MRSEEMCVQFIKRPDVIQTALRYRCIGRFSYPRAEIVRSRTCPRISGARERHQLSSIMAEERFESIWRFVAPAAGGLRLASYITVVSGRKAARKRQGRILSQISAVTCRIKEKIAHAQPYLFIGLIRPRRDFICATGRPAFYICPFDVIVISSAVSRKVYRRRRESIIGMNIRHRMFVIFRANSSASTNISHLIS